MPKTHPISVSAQTHGLTGDFVLPDEASANNPVPGAVIVGGPGPVPLQRYGAEGFAQWPVQWSELLASTGVAAMCLDQRGSGLSSGSYHEANWDALYEDAKAAVEILEVQPEVTRTAAIAWAEGCHFALELAASGTVDAVVLLAPAYHDAAERYARQIGAVAAKGGLSDRVVQLRIGHWQRDLAETARRVTEGEQITTTQIGGRTVTTNLERFLRTQTFDPKVVVGQVRVPVLILHGEEDTVIPPSESAAMVKALPHRADRITYPGVAHFLYRHPQAMQDAAAWLKRTLAQ